MTHISKEVIAGIKIGDRTSFNRLYEIMYLPLCKYSNSILNDYEQTSELVQEVFIKIWETRERIDEESNFRAYMFQILHNACINHLRHLKVRKRYIDHIAFIANDLFSIDRDELVESELVDRIKITIESLSPKCKEAFEMSRFQGMKYKQIAEVLNISQKTVESHVSKALKILRKNLDEFKVLLLIIFNSISG